MATVSKPSITEVSAHLMMHEDDAAMIMLESVS